MGEHTKEPWEVGCIEDTPGEKYWTVGGRGLLFARLPSNHPEMLPNAKRIVACVNACVPLANAQLNDGIIFAALLCLSRIVDDLPQNRDWLDPDIEKLARSVVTAATDKTKAQALAPTDLADAARGVLSRILKTPSGYLSIVDDEPTRDAIAKLTAVLEGK